MASPVDAGRIAGASTALSSWSTSLPSGNQVGDLLILMFRTGAAATVTSISGGTGTWTQLLFDQADATDDSTYVYYCVEAAQLSPVINLSAAVKGAWIIWRITGAANPATQAPQVSTVQVFTTAANAGNAPAISPTGGSKDYLFLTCLGQGGTGPTSSMGPPSGYTPQGIWNAASTGGSAATNCAIAYGGKQATAATEDAGVWTHPAATGGGCAFTIAIHPGVAAPVVSGAATLSGSGALAATGKRVVRGAATLTGAGSLSGAGGVPPKTYRERVLFDGARFYWRLGESSGATAVDAAGTLNATHYDLAAGAFGQSGALTASGDADTSIFYFTSGGYSGTTQAVPDTRHQQLANWTLEAWVYRTATSSSYPGVASHKWMPGNSSCAIILQPNNIVWTGFFINGVGWKKTDDTVAVPLNTWVHLVGTWDGTTVRMYHNGVEVSSAAQSGYAYAPSNADFRIGCAPDSGNSFPGRIDEVALYPTALSAGSILAHYTIGSTPPPATVTGQAALTGAGALTADGRVPVPIDVLIPEGGDAAICGQVTCGEMLCGAIASGDIWNTYELALVGTDANLVGGASGSAALTGAGALSATGKRTVRGVAVLTGSGTLVAIGIRKRFGAAVLTGVGTLAGTGRRRQLGAAALTGLGTLSATAKDFATVLGQGALTGAGALAATGRRTTRAVAALTGAGALSSTGKRTTKAAATFTGSGALTATGTRKKLGAAALTGAGSLTANSRSTRRGAAALSGIGTLTANPGTVNYVFGAAALSGQGTLAVTGTQRTVKGAATLSGSGALAATSKRITRSTAALTGTGTLSATSRSTKTGQAALVGTGSLTATGLVRTAPDVTIVVATTGVLELADGTASAQLDVVIKEGFFVELLCGPDVLSGEEICGQVFSGQRWRNEQLDLFDGGYASTHTDVVIKEGDLVELLCGPTVLSGQWLCGHLFSGTRWNKYLLDLPTSVTEITLTVNPSIVARDSAPLDLVAGVANVLLDFTANAVDSQLDLVGVAARVNPILIEKVCIDLALGEITHTPLDLVQLLPEPLDLGSVTHTPLALDALGCITSPDWLIIGTFLIGTELIGGFPAILQPVGCEES